MARSFKAKHGHIGREYWSRRPGSMGDWGAASKAFTHRAERAIRSRLMRFVVFVAGLAHDDGDTDDVASSVFPVSGRREDLR